VIEASHIACVGKSGSHAYATVRNSLNKQSFKTKVIKKTLDPKWDQEFLLFTSKAEGQLFVKIWHRDLFRKDGFLGELTIPIANFEDGQKQDKWYKLSNEPEKKKKDPASGEVHLEIFFTPSPNSGASDKPQADNKEGKAKKKGSSKDR
jgi:Ca2+-dependent lipid-binding protein